MNSIFTVYTHNTLNQYTIIKNISTNYFNENKIMRRKDQKEPGPAPPPPLSLLRGGGGWG